MLNFYRAGALAGTRPLLPLSVTAESLRQEIDERPHLGRKQRAVRIERPDDQFSRAPVGEQRHQPTECPFS